MQAVRSVADRSREQLILQLLLAIVLGRVREVARRVVAGAVFELQIRPLQPHLDPAEPAVARGLVLE